MDLNADSMQVDRQTRRAIQDEYGGTGLILTYLAMLKILVDQ